jgi:CheY-like chemotaxis protein
VRQASRTSIGSVIGKATSTPPGSPRASLRILLAEDNLINQRVGVALLKKLGHSVDVVADGKQAVEQVQAKSYDAILMDVEMPEMDGFEATAAIRAWEQGKGTRIPIVAMTAHALTGYRERCIAAGMDGYISKPVSLDQFAAQLQTIHPETPSPSGLGDRPPQENGASTVLRKPAEAIQSIPADALPTLRR